MATNEKAVDPMRAAFDSVIAAERGDVAPAADTGFSTALKDEGISVTVREKPEAPTEAASALAPKSPAAATPAASPEPVGEDGPDADEGAQGDGEGFAEDGLDLLVQSPAAGQVRDARIAETEAIEAEALELGIGASLAKALARNVGRKEAREFLDSRRANLQSPSAGQPVAPISAPTGYERPEANVAEILRTVESEAGEATAKAVGDLYASLSAQVHQTQQMVQESQMRQHQATERAEWMGAADGLSGRFPGLVREGRVNPEVAGYAASLFASGPLAGNKAAALETAAKLVYGQESASARQPTTATPAPRTPTPGGTELPNDGAAMSGLDLVNQALEIERRYANQPDERKRAHESLSRLTQTRKTSIFR